MKTTLNIKGMTCQHCVASVDNGLKHVPGVEKVKVNLKKGIAKVSFNEQEASMETLKQAVETAGYQVEEA